MTNHEYYLGTPALAAKFLQQITERCDVSDCKNCPLGPPLECSDYQEVKAWLESEME